MINRFIKLLLVVGTLSALSVVALPQARADTSTPIAEKTYRTLLVPNDPIYPQWYTDKISAPQAWDITTGSSDVIVAVIDTGFGLSHEDMVGRWAVNSGESGPTTQEGPAPNCTSRSLVLDKSCNNLDDDGNGKIDDWRGWDFVQNDNDPSAGSVNPEGAGVSHGTITAGLVGATGNNAKGVASLNWGAKILPLQALNDDGEGTTTTVAAAIDYAVAQGAKVISLSLGSDGPDDFLRQRINAAINQGVVVVAAAGNSGCDCMVYPANYPEVIAVGATNSDDVRASFSSYGANLDVMAPGTGTIRAPFWSSANQTTLYTSSISGTSISTPIVAGLAGLLKTQSPTATAGDIVSFITSGTDKVSGMGGLNRSDQYGWGRVNANRSLVLTAVIHPDGTLIKPSSSHSVYLIEAGARRFVPSPAVFISNWPDWDRIKTATVADMVLSAGPDINFREGTLLKGSSASIYIVDITSGGAVTKRSFSSWPAFSGLGYTTAEVMQVSDAQLPAANGPDINY